MIRKFHLSKPTQKIGTALQQKIDQKTKPLGSLGRLENIAYKIGLIQQSLNPSLKQPHLIVFAGDHGIQELGLSAYPGNITQKMVYNFVSEGAAVNVFTRQHGIKLLVVDAGVNADLPEDLPIIHAKIAHGTHNYMHQAAMSPSQGTQAIDSAAELVTKIQQEGSNVIAFGEMGIANTSSASLLMHLTTQIPLSACIGRGSGLDDEALEKKRDILSQALDNHIDNLENPWDYLLTFGGFEVAMMVGGMLQAAELGMLILVDGFISTAALLVAHSLYPEILDYCIFSHQSQESGHQLMLSYLGVEPLLSFNLRLGEGTGTALIYPLLESALKFLNEMATFDDMNQAI